MTMLESFMAYQSIRDMLVKEKGIKTLHLDEQNDKIICSKDDKLFTVQSGHLSCTPHIKINGCTVDKKHALKMIKSFVAA